MKERFINSSLFLINKYNNYTEEEIDNMRYGLEGIYLTLGKTIIILLLAFVLDIMKEVVLLIVLFNIIRYTGFGFHAEKSSTCLYITLIEFIAFPYIIMKVNIPNYIYYILILCCIIMYFLYAPADTIKRPLLNRRKRIIRKILTITIGIIYTIGIVLISNVSIKKILLLSMILEAIFISTFIYKLFKQPYRNYLTYSDV